jgi:hypothetical protein
VPGGKNAGANGTVNLGAGGGGGSTDSSNGGNGGNGSSGVVIIKYPKTFIFNIGAGLTQTTSTIGNYKITTFTAGTDDITLNI